MILIHSQNIDGEDIAKYVHIRRNGKNICGRIKGDSFFEAFATYETEERAKEVFKQMMGYIDTNKNRSYSIPKK